MMPFVDVFPTVQDNFSIRVSGDYLGCKYRPCSIRYSNRMTEQGVEVSSSYFIISVEGAKPPSTSKVWLVFVTVRGSQKYEAPNPK